VEVNMAKYVSYIIDTLNHDTTISNLLDPNARIAKLLTKHRAELSEQGQISMDIQ
jgi:ribose-phosphate pyrophosphokinase